jgi:hypothetical protein
MSGRPPRGQLHRGKTSFGRHCCIEAKGALVMPQSEEKVALGHLENRDKPGIWWLGGGLLDKRKGADRSMQQCRRNCRQVVSVQRAGAGGIRSRWRTRRIVEAPTRWPSLSSSPWILWYPQLGFSLAMRSINTATASSTGGRPRRFGYVYFLVTRRRCQRRIVPGVTNRCTRSIGGRARTSAANTARSAQSIRGWGLALRSTASS